MIPFQNNIRNNIQYVKLEVTLVVIPFQNNIRNNYLGNSQFSSLVVIPFQNNIRNNTKHHFIHVKVVVIPFQNNIRNNIPSDKPLVDKDLNHFNQRKNWAYCKELTIKSMVFGFVDCTKT